MLNNPTPVTPIVAPPMPTTWEKNIPRLVILIGGMLGAAGTFYSTEVAKDPETEQVVGTKVDIGAVLTAVTGAMTTIGGLFLQAQNNGKAEKAVEHVEVAAAAAVVTMAATPPVGLDGKMTVENTLSSALVQAAEAQRYKDAGKILTLIGSLEEGQKGGAA